MNIKTNLLEEYVNYVDNTKKQKKRLMDIFNYSFIYSVCVYNYNNILIRIYKWLILLL